MKRIIYSLLIVILFNSNCKTQEDSNYSLININQTEVKLLIDSIWKEVVSWDGDTSKMTILKRERYASDLEDYFLRHQKENTELDSPEGKALLYSFFIRFRNNDHSKIIESFNTNLSDISSELWLSIYPIYFKNLKIELKQSNNWIDTLDKQACCDISTLHKVVMWNDIARYHYLHESNMIQARAYFSKIVNVKRHFPESLFKDIKLQAESFIHKIDSLQIGSKAPSFCSQDINNNKICFNSDQNKVVLLEFWASWCLPCIEELPKIKQMYEIYQDRIDFQMISISLDKNIEILRNFIVEHNLEWPQIFEGEDMTRKGKITLLYNGLALPTYYVIGKDGLIYYNYDSRKNGVNIDEVVKKLMEE